MYRGCHHQANCVLIVVVILRLILSRHNTTSKAQDGYAREAGIDYHAGHNYGDLASESDSNS